MDLNPIWRMWSCGTCNQKSWALIPEVPLPYWFFFFNLRFIALWLPKKKKKVWMLGRGRSKAWGGTFGAEQKSPEGSRVTVTVGQEDRG